MPPSLPPIPLLEDPEEPEPERNISMAKIPVEAVHNIHEKAANAASARAAAHTFPRQKRSLPRKTDRAMKPAK
jgi:hypothetical protein